MKLILKYLMEKVCSLRAIQYNLNPVYEACKLLRTIHKHLSSIIRGISKLAPPLVTNLWSIPPPNCLVSAPVSWADLLSLLHDRPSCALRRSSARCGGVRAPPKDQNEQNDKKYSACCCSASVWPDWAIYCNFSKPVATIIVPKLPTF